MDASPLVGCRTEIPSDAEPWKTGDRFGVIVRARGRWVWVRLDRSGEVHPFPVVDLRTIAPKAGAA